MCLTECQSPGGNPKPGKLHFANRDFLRILKEGRQYDDLTEVAKLFNIHAAE